MIAENQRYFPHEAQGIDGYFNDMENTVNGLKNIGKLSNPLQAAKGAEYLKWMRATGADLINAHINDPVLRGVLAGQSGDHGMPPSQVSAFMHAGITNHYFNGGLSIGRGVHNSAGVRPGAEKGWGEIRLSYA